MAKVRITITITKEYEQVPEHYPPELRTPEAMLRIDLDSVNDDPYVIMGSDGAHWDIKGETVSDTKE